MTRLIASLKPAAGLAASLALGVLGLCAAGPPPASLPASQSHEHWAFQAPLSAPVPKAKFHARVRTPVDAFVLARLEARKLSFSPDAARTALLRRVFLDLTGLPPSPEEAGEFIADARADAFERLVDRLLASPHFGERWGRHWLDAAGHVDVIGGDNDAGTIKLGEAKWRYRDYVVRSFNQDKPFTRFLVEQFAGDELVDWRAAEKFTPELKELLVATGFLRTAADDTDEDELNTADIRHGILERTAEVALNNVLALTVGCAKCHDHKYEPVTQREYYELLANFSPAFDPARWLQPKQRTLPDVSTVDKAAMEKHNATFDVQIEEIRQRQATLRRACEDRLLDSKLLALPEASRADAKVAIRLPSDKRNDAQRLLVEKFGTMIRVKPEEVSAALNPADMDTLTRLDLEIASLAPKRRTWGTIHAVYDAGAPMPFHLLRRGNPFAPGEPVEPGFLRVLDWRDKSTPAPRPAGNSSGRRLALAHWLTDADSPAAGLAARVLVNRAWQQLFGRGIVETSDNFGVSGQRPTHPELLDWLAVEFMRDGWRMKPLLRLIMTSTVYRQSASPATTPQTITAEKADPGNQLLWHQRLRRLESEVVRDSILATSGCLDRTLGGPSLQVENRADGLVVVKTSALSAPSAAWRRSLYILARRNYHPTLLAAFDHPVMMTSCAKRTQSAVVGQSLTMLNDAFVLEQAEQFAQRVTKSALGEARQIELAFQLALARAPAARELEWSAIFLQRQRGRYVAEKQTVEQAAHRAMVQLCHTLLNTSEFLYAP